MNIVTAPLALLFSPSDSSIMTNLVPGAPAGGGDAATLFFKAGTLITLIMIAAGIYLLVTKVPGSVLIEGQGYKLTTDNGGIALIVLGLLFYLGIGWLIMGRSK